MLKARYGFFVRGCTETIHRDPKERYYTENEVINKIRGYTNLQFKNADILLDGQCVRKVTPDDCKEPLPEEFEIELQAGHLETLRDIQITPIRWIYYYHPYKGGKIVWHGEEDRHSGIAELRVAGYVKWIPCEDDDTDAHLVLTEFGKAQVAKVGACALEDEGGEE